MEGKLVNETWLLLKTVIADHVPLRKAKRTDKPQWLDAEMRKTILIKQRAWAEWKRTG